MQLTSKAATLPGCAQELTGSETAPSTSARVTKMHFATSIVLTGNTSVRTAREETARSPREASFLEAAQRECQQAVKAWSLTGCSGQFAVLKKHPPGTIWCLSGLAKASRTIRSQVSPDSDVSGPHDLVRWRARPDMPGALRGETPQLLSVLNCPRIFISLFGHMKGILNPR